VAGGPAGFHSGAELVWLPLAFDRAEVGESWFEEEFVELLLGQGDYDFALAEFGGVVGGLGESADQGDYGDGHDGCGDEDFEEGEAALVSRRAVPALTCWG
jgi:hypothetical protein